MLRTYTDVKLLRKQAVNIFEGFEFKRITGWIEKKHCCLLARFALKANVRLNDEFGVRRFETIGQSVPFAHLQHNAEMAARHVVAINIASFRHRAFLGREVGHNLMTIKIEIDPMIGRTPFFTPQQVKIELAGSGEIVGGKSEMEGLDRHE
jgi:hypothetical protein